MATPVTPVTLKDLLLLQAKFRGKRLIWFIASIELLLKFIYGDWKGGFKRKLILKDVQCIVKVFVAGQYHLKKYL